MTFYQQSHEDVGTSTAKFSKADLDEYVSHNNRGGYYEDPLDRDQVSALYSCFHRNTCELYTIFSESSYMSGYGTSTHFVLIEKNDPLRIIEHMTYSE